MSADPSTSTGSDVGDAEVLARVALSRCAEPGDAVFGAWLAERGAVRAVGELRSGQCGLRRARDLAARLALADPVADLDRAGEAGVRVVVPGTPDWPTQLDDLGPARPVLLWLRGPADLRLSALCSVALVGSRAATAYGEAVALELAAELGTQKWTVVSGGAYGIDAAAHRGALAVEAPTIAVLANGPDRVYPRGNDALLARVADTGLLVTELAPGEHPTRSRFLERNRLIAALSRGTVVVEAARRSGALGTAARATALSRPVMGVPGPVTSAASAGVHALVRDQQATLVTGVRDVLELVAPLGTLADPDDPDDPGDPEPDVHSVLGALAPRRARPADEVAARAGVPERAVLGLLGELGARGLAERVEGGWRRAGPVG